VKKEDSCRIISELSVFFAKFFMQDINEVVICNLLGFPRE
jgi:hypothetical protein